MSTLGWCLAVGVLAFNAGMLTAMRIKNFWRRSRPYDPCLDARPAANSNPAGNPGVSEPRMGPWSEASRRGTVDLTAGGQTQARAVHALSRGLFRSTGLSEEEK